MSCQPSKLCYSLQMDPMKASPDVKAFLLDIASRGGVERNKKLSKKRKYEIAMMGVAARKKLQKK